MHLKILLKFCCHSATSFLLFSNPVGSFLQNYVRPVLVYDDEPVQIHIHGGRHPVGI